MEDNVDGFQRRTGLKSEGYGDATLYRGGNLCKGRKGRNIFQTLLKKWNNILNLWRNSEKWKKDLYILFSIANMQMANKLTKRGLISLVTRQMQTKAIVRYHLVSSEWLSSFTIYENQAITPYTINLYNDVCQ